MKLDELFEQIWTKDTLLYLNWALLQHVQSFKKSPTVLTDWYFVAAQKIIVGEASVPYSYAMVECLEVYVLIEEGFQTPSMCLIRCLK